MSASIKHLRELAEAEVAAEQGRDRADVKWRKAWWELTLELGEIPSSPREELSKRLRAVEEITGQTNTWLSKRRRTGAFFVVLAHNEAVALPPRLAVVAVDSKPEETPEQIAQKLRDYEAGDVSLRDAAEALTGKSWTAVPENLTDKQKAAITNSVLRTTPELVAPAAVAGAAQHPDHARAIARNSNAVDLIEGAVSQQTASVIDDLKRQGTQSLNRSTGNVAKALEMNNAVEAMRTAVGAIGEAIFAQEEWGVEGYEDEWAEMIKRAEHLLRVAKSSSKITQDDSEFLASIGIEAP